MALRNLNNFQWKRLNFAPDIRDKAASCLALPRKGETVSIIAQKNMPNNGQGHSETKGRRALQKL